MRPSVPLLSVPLLLVPLALFIASCSEQAPPPTQTAPAEPAAENEDVLVTFYPTRYFAERIAGPHATIKLPLPVAEDPIFWQPDPDTIAQYQSARLVILNGAEFEKWALTAPLPRSRVVNTAIDFRDEWIEFEHAVSHSHGPSGEHSHAGIDGHTWLDPLLAIKQARDIERALTDAFPLKADTFAINLMSLESDLRRINDRLVELTPDVGRVRLLASHPAYNYLAQRYGWEIINLDLDPEAPLSEEGVGDILRAAGDDAARPIVLLWESEPRRATRAMLDAAGVTSVLFSPAENPTPDELELLGDYMQIMRSNVDRLRNALDG